MKKKEIIALADEYCNYLKNKNLKAQQAKELEQKLLPVFTSVLAHSMVDCIIKGKSGKEAYNFALDNAEGKDPKTTARMSLFMAQMINNGTVPENIFN